jgi:hypothetical protein
MWKKSDIEAWGGEDAEVITFTPSLTPPVHPALPAMSDAQVRKGLKALGVKLPE